MKKLLLFMLLPLLFLAPDRAKSDDVLDFMPAILASCHSDTIEGSWDLTVTFGDGSTNTMYMNLANVDGNWVTCEPGMQEPVTVDGDHFSFVKEGYTFTGTVHSSGSMSGTWEEGTWSMAKNSPTVFCGEYEPWNLADPLPKFVSSDFTELDKIVRVSRFRSGIGHDYSDDYESCRSMKHYYTPLVADWSEVNVFSPVNGQVVAIRSEWAGSQVKIQSTQYPSFFFTLFHVDLDPSISVQAMVAAGQRIGNHIGNQTTQDVAVLLTVRDGDKREKLVSFIDVMTDSLFASYNQLSTDRDDFVISKEERDVSLLQCDEDENFEDEGSITNWVTRK